MTEPLSSELQQLLTYIGVSGGAINTRPESERPSEVLIHQALLELEEAGRVERIRDTADWVCWKVKECSDV